MRTPKPRQEAGVDHWSLRPLLTVQQVMALLHVGRTTVYDLIAREELPAIHFGRSIRVMHYDVEMLLTMHADGIQQEEATLDGNAITIR